MRLPPLCKLAISIVILFVLSGMSAAACHTVRAGASGNGSGSDWTNAYPDLPTALVRGDSYYVAAGNYGSHTFNDADSGSSIITIVAPTAGDHCTDTGWSSGFVGQAVFRAPACFLTDYYTFNGAYRNDSNWATESAYGFKVNNDNGSHVPFNTNGAILVGSDGSNGCTASQKGASNIMIKYTAARGSGALTTYMDSTVRFEYDSVNNYIGESYVVEGINDLRITNQNTFTVERNWLGNNRGVGGHAEIVNINNWDANYPNKDLTIRYNYMANGVVAGAISTAGATVPTGSGFWDMYGNVFYCNSGEYGSWQQCQYGDGVISLHCYSAVNGLIVRFVNNTIANLNNAGSTGIFDQPQGNNCTSNVLPSQFIVENNLWYNSFPLAAQTGGYYAWNNNTYWDMTQTESDSTSGVQIVTGQPSLFVNVSQTQAGADNFNLNTDTVAWVALPAPYNVDLAGVTRSSSRGLFQFGSAPPTSPTNLVVTVN